MADNRLPFELKTAEERTAERADKIKRAAAWPRSDPWLEYLQHYAATEQKMREGIEDAIMAAQGMTVAGDPATAAKTLILTRLREAHQANAAHWQRTELTAKFGPEGASAVLAEPEDFGLSEEQEKKLQKVIK